MQNADDNLWRNLVSAYQTPLDPRPLIAKLETRQDTENTWNQLWEQLHHQGNVGTASYASVPLLVDIYNKQTAIDWNIYAIVATVELARANSHNPELPKWLTTDYFQALRELAEIGVAQVLRTEDKTTAQAILGVIAIAKGLLVRAKFIVEYTEAELLEIGSQH